MHGNTWPLRQKNSRAGTSGQKQSLSISCFGSQRDRYMEQILTFRQLCRRHLFNCSHLRINPVDLRAAIPFKLLPSYYALSHTEVLHLWYGNFLLRKVRRDIPNHHQNDSLQPLHRARLRSYTLKRPLSLQDSRNRNVKTWSRPTSQ